MKFVADPNKVAIAIDAQKSSAVEKALRTPAGRPFKFPDCPGFQLAECGAFGPGFTKFCSTLILSVLLARWAFLNKGIAEATRYTDSRPETICAF